MERVGGNPKGSIRAEPVAPQLFEKVFPRQDFHAVGGFARPWGAAHKNRAARLELAAMLAQSFQPENRLELERGAARLAYKPIVWTCVQKARGENYPKSENKTGHTKK